MTVYGVGEGQSAPIEFALRTAGNAAQNLVRKVLPPVIADIVVAEMRWWTESTWTANHAKLRLVIAEVEALAAGTERAA